MSKLRHDANRDTMWLGKNVPNVFLTIFVVVLAGGLLAYFLRL